MTYSIIARDPATGQMGAAVQTCNIAVGTWVPWAHAGIGAVATQAVAERRYGVAGLDLIASGYTAEEALNTLLAADPKRELRQVSMVDHAGNIATHTGKCCIPEAGSFRGDTFCTQANMMANDTVWKAMAEAFQASTGGLVDRLMTALEAAQGAGGDLRGRQTAALLVVESEPSPFPLFDLRVDHNPDPLQELRRLIKLQKAYSLEYQIVNCVERGELDPILDLINQIRELAPDEPYLQCLCALHFERALNSREEALAILHPLIQAHPQWRTYLERELAAGSVSGCSAFDPQLLVELDRRQISVKEKSR